MVRTYGDELGGESPLKGFVVTSRYKMIIKIDIDKLCVYTRNYERTTFNFLVTAYSAECACLNLRKASRFITSLNDLKRLRVLGAITEGEDKLISGGK